jgi:anti-sigma regulatory factor (Ser/Thr protein kinase)
LTAEPYHRLVIPNQLSEVRKMSDWLNAITRAMDMPEEIVFKFDLCANEAVTNIISYAYPEDGPHEIALSLRLEGDMLILEIEDDGMSFNPLDRWPHVQPESVEKAEIGGLGIDLIRKFMDECRYDRQDGKNILQIMANTAR